jgi:hypothetical protein
MKVRDYMQKVFGKPVRQEPKPQAPAAAQDSDGHPIVYVQALYHGEVKLVPMKWNDAARMLSPPGWF